MRTIDPDGRIRGHPWPRVTWQGDISARVTQSGGWWPHPTTSGLCFTRTFLEQVMPMPEPQWKICSEAYLVNLAPMIGPVWGMAEPLASYRNHGNSYWLSATRESPQGAFRHKAEQFRFEFDQLRAAMSTHPWGHQTTQQLSLDDHFRFQYYRRQAGDPVSIIQVLRPISRCPVLPPAARLREMTKFLLGRG